MATRSLRTSACAFARSMALLACAVAAMPSAAALTAPKPGVSMPRLPLTFE
jgi:hypothetical protein